MKKLSFSPDQSFSSAESASSRPSTAANLALMTLLAVSQACGTTPTDGRSEAEPNVSEATDDKPDEAPAEASLIPVRPTQPVLVVEIEDDSEGSSEGSSEEPVFGPFSPGNDSPTIDLDGLNNEDPNYDPEIQTIYVVFCEVYFPGTVAIRIGEHQFGFCTYPIPCEFEPAPTSIQLHCENGEHYVAANLATSRLDLYESYSTMPQGFIAYPYAEFRNRLVRAEERGIEINPETLESMEARSARVILEDPHFDTVEDFTVEMDFEDPMAFRVVLENICFPENHTHCNDTPERMGLCEVAYECDGPNAYVAYIPTGVDDLVSVFRIVGPIDEDVLGVMVQSATTDQRLFEWALDQGLLSEYEE